MSHSLRFALIGTIALAAVAPVASAQRLPVVTPRAGLVITRSVRIRPGTYRLRAPESLDSALISVRGSGIMVDMRGVHLVGLAPESDPDSARGVAIRVDGGHHVRLVGAAIRGYRFGILSRGTRELTLDSNDVSFGWKPRLYSGITHESLVDWLSFHHDEKGEWLRFGAGIFLDDVRGGEVRGNVGRQGMNGLMMTRADSLVVRDNDFSYNSGLGIGMYRSSRNSIVHNRADYDVRGYSHGFYRRGQDSAALLMFEQCSDNVVAYNSMTHGGDGLFLWAGQQTMDTGAGGSNDNLFWGNDFSFAPTNGMEATFSRNWFVSNRIEGSDHGLWGGYSWESRVFGNTFSRNRIGIAWEHGQDNEVEQNFFIGDSTGIRLWADSIAPSDWGYPKHRDTGSRGWTITGNRFVGNRVGVTAEHTTGILEGNTFTHVVSPTLTPKEPGLAFGTNVMQITDSYVDRGKPVLGEKILERKPAMIAGSFLPDTQSATSAARRPRSAIIVDEWGPYDWRSPKLWPADSGHGDTLRLQVLGPSGRWRVLSSKDASVSRERGAVPDTIVVIPTAAGRTDWNVVLEYRGGETVTPRGTVRRANVPVTFHFGHFEPSAAWQVRWFAWDSLSDPRRDSAAFARVLRGAPLLTQQVPRLDWLGYGAPVKSLPREKLAMEASASINRPAGEYTLRTISDDAVRVWVDGKLAIDAWSPHESRVDLASLTGGAHALRVEYLNVDGWYELRLDILRGAVTGGAGSPGPH